jgi:hypothetical protein
MYCPYKLYPTLQQPFNLDTKTWENIKTVLLTVTAKKLAQAETLVTCTWADPGSSFRREAHYHAKGFFGLSQVSQANSATLIQIRSLIFPSTYFQLHYSLLISPFDDPGIRY